MRSTRNEWNWWSRRPRNLEASDSDRSSSGLSLALLPRQLSQFLFDHVDLNGSGGSGEGDADVDLVYGVGTTAQVHVGHGASDSKSHEQDNRQILHGDIVHHEERHARS